MFKLAKGDVEQDAVERIVIAGVVEALLGKLRFKATMRAR